MPLNSLRKLLASLAGGNKPQPVNKKAKWGSKKVGFRVGTYCKLAEGWYRRASLGWCKVVCAEQRLGWCRVGVELISGSFSVASGS